MSLYDYETRNVTFMGEVFEIDGTDPLDAMLAEAAKEYDRLTDQIIRDSKALAVYSTRIAESAEENPYPMGGMPVERLASDIITAQAKRESVANQLAMARHYIVKKAEG